MEIYDLANELATQVKKSKEYNDLKQAKKIINQNNEYKTKIAEFEKLRYEEQMEQIQTGRQNVDKMNKIKEIYSNLINIEEIRNYFDAELKFNILFGDINKILSESIKDII